MTTIAKHNNDDDGPERALIQRALATIESRLATYRAATEAQLQNLTFLQRRNSELVDDLQLAHDALALRDEELAKLKGDLAPLEVVYAMCQPAGQWQPVSLEVDGIRYSFLVPGLGREDHLAAARWWRTFKARYANEVEA